MPHSDLIRPSYANGFAPRDGAALCESFRQGLVGNWHAPLGQTGLKAVETSDRAKDGVLDGATWVSDGPVGDVWSFSGSSATDQILVPHTPSLSVGREAGSLVAYCKPQVQTEFFPTLFDKTAGSNSLSLHEYIFYMDRGTTDMSFALMLGGVVIKTPASTWIADEWQLLAITWDGTTVRFYRDGIEVHSDTQQVGYDTNTAELHVGRLELASSSQSYDGLLAFAAIYDKTLSEPELQKLAEDSDALVRLAERQMAVKAPVVPTRYYYQQLLGGAV